MVTTCDDLPKQPVTLARDLLKRLTSKTAKISAISSSESRKPTWQTEIQPFLSSFEGFGAAFHAENELRPAWRSREA